MRVGAFDVIAAERFHLAALAKNINRLFQVPAGDDNGSRAHFHQFLSRGFHRVQVFYFEASQKFRLWHVGRNHADALQQFVAHKFQTGRIDQLLVPRSRPENRIEDHVREFVLVQEFRHGHRIAAIRKHADFYGRDCDIIRQLVKLRAQLSGRRCMHGLHALRGLHRQGGDCRHAVAIVRRKRLQIGADARAARRIESRDGQKNWWSVVRVIVQLSAPPARGLTSDNCAGAALLPLGTPANKNVRVFRTTTQQ